MTLYRRRFLQGSLSATAALTGALGTARSQTSNVPRPAFTILTEIDLWRDGRALASVLDAFSEQGHPVACVIDPTTTPDRSPSGQTLAVDVLRERLRRKLGPLELIPYRRDLATLTPYAMARATFETRKACINAVNPARDEPLPFRFSSIACADIGAPLAPHGILATGFRTCLIIPNGQKPVSGESWQNGTVRIFGGTHPNWVHPPIEANLSDTTQFADVKYLSLRDLQHLAPEDIKSIAVKFARTQIIRELAGEITLLPVADLALRDNFGFSRRIGLHLFRPSEADSGLQPGFRLLKAELTRLGFAFSEGNLTKDGTDLGAQTYWAQTRNPSGTSTSFEVLDQLETPENGIVLASESKALPGFPIRLDAIDTANLGVDAQGALNTPALSVEGLQKNIRHYTEGRLSSQNFVLTVQPNIAGSTPSRTALLRLLQKIDQDGLTEFQGLRSYAKNLYPQSSLITRFQKVQVSDTNIQPARRTRRPDNLRDAYIADARHAWSYIESYTDGRSGLCPSVVDTNGGVTKLETVTMWDVASLLNALPAAEALGIIDRDEMETRVRHILPNLLGRETDGRRLPQEWIRTDRVKWGNRNFDVCDTGRLLAALWGLAKIEWVDFGIRELVESWDLDKIIVDGHLHSVVDGKFLSATGSHCAHYAALAFRRWGYGAVSPYEVFQNESATDDRMRLLHRANSIGVLGAEPLLLEGCDFGLTVESDYLADVLIAAQADAFNRTGVLVGVSETPLDKSPWFAYQGLVLDNLQKEWSVVAASEDEKFKSADFERANQVVSSKAAYLWAAFRPHEYSDRLVALIRTQGKAQTGFVSGVYASPERPMTGYTDLNTNGIILQAIWKLIASE